MSETGNPSNPMKATVFLIAVAIIGVGVLYAKTYEYRCGKCGLVLSYQQPGIVKCPQDGSSMMPKW